MVIPGIDSCISNYILFLAYLLLWSTTACNTIVEMLSVEILHLVFFWSNDRNMCPINCTDTLTKATHDSETILNLYQLLIWCNLYEFWQKNIRYSFTNIVGYFATRRPPITEQLSNWTVVMTCCLHSAIATLFLTGMASRNGVHFFLNCAASLLQM
jgi:hypothetical protein